MTRSHVSTRDSNYQTLLDLGRSPAEAEIELMERPSWDDYWMGLAFYTAMRSPDAQTKQGCLIVDWETKTMIGGGYNGHLPSCNGHPVHRAGTKLLDGTVQGKPDKYDCMMHADENAIGRIFRESDHAVMYVTMTPCERCFTQAMTSPRIKLRRIIYFEERDFHVTKWLVDEWNKAHPFQEVEMVLYGGVAKGFSAEDALMQAARYMQLRRQSQTELSTKSTHTYRDINTNEQRDPNSVT